MKLISTLIFLLCVTFAFAECYDNHFDECRIERQNGKYGIVIDKQLAIPYEYDEIVPQHNCFFKVRKGRKYGIISYFYEEHKRDGRFPKEIDRPIALKKGYAWLYLSLACEYDKIEEYENQYLQISRDDRKGIVNYYGTLVLPCRFEKIELSNNFFGYRRKGYTEFTTGTVRQLSPAAITRSNSPTVVFTSAGTGSKVFTTAMEVLLSLANSARSNAKTMPIT